MIGSIGEEIDQYAMPIAILVGLFLIRRYGTRKVGTFFGPVTALYFITTDRYPAASAMQATSATMPHM